MKFIYPLTPIIAFTDHFPDIRKMVPFPFVDHFVDANKMVGFDSDNHC